MVFIDQYVCHQGYTLSVRYILLRHPPIYAPSLSLTHSLTHSLYLLLLFSLGPTSPPLVLQENCVLPGRTTTLVRPRSR